MNTEFFISQNQYQGITDEKVSYLSEISVFQEEQAEQVSMLSKQNKPIRKTAKKAGRPKNSDLQKQYTKSSSRFTIPIWHFSRIMLFTHLFGNKKGNQLQALFLSPQQTIKFNKAVQFMQKDNFPSFKQWNQVFILHPNSLHSFMQSLRKSGEIQVNSQQMKMYLCACLYRRNLLCLTIYKYISNYWPDILKLVKQSLTKNLQIKSKSQERYVQIQQNIQDSKADLEKQLKEDQSIIAYEIACYIKACCEVSQIRLRK